MGQTLARAAFYPVDWTLDTLQSLTGPRSGDTWSLKSNFAPISKELFQDNLPIQGVLPADLAGEFVRNGPNPKYIPKGKSDFKDHTIKFTDGSSQVVIIGSMEMECYMEYEFTQTEQPHT
jgi:carotenoid cleavage dioxygenase-like enzyme